MSRRARRSLVAALAAATALAAAACDTERHPMGRRQLVAGGDPTRAEALFQRYGCVSCHTIPGIRGANALVGPPLTSWAERRYVAGHLPNDPESLVRFILDPAAEVPGTAMPNTGVTEHEARHMAAYLYTLQ